MALNALTTNFSASTSHAQPVDPSPSQPGPLPSKRGELGFREGQNVEENTTAEVEEPVNLPERHPADRGGPSGDIAGTNTPVPSLPITDSTTPSPSHDNPSTPSKARIISFLSFKTLGGIHWITLLLVILQILLVAGTVIAWVYGAQRLSRSAGSAFQSPEISIVIHVMFATALIGQLIFVERRIFRLRAERYAYLHPGEMLPTSRRISTASANMRLAPWHRPSLPTYAAALAASGHGTGDVEDHIIAAPPPPAYGNTRGSTLILSGYLRESLRAQRPPSSSSQMSSKSERSLSYVSSDGSHRMARLEETLARLEEGGRSGDLTPDHR